MVLEYSLNSDLHLFSAWFNNNYLKVNTLFFFIRTSNFWAEAERSYFFYDLRLKTFLRSS